MRTVTDLSRAFDRDAAAYERARPSYPPAAVEHLRATFGLGPGTRVLDLGAGTGKLTRLLTPLGCDVVAVEPGPKMREELAATTPGVEILDGTGEAIPLPDASVDAITIAQAFHWLDPARAVPELARVLRPGGGLALVWNVRDSRVPWVAELQRVQHWTTHAPYDETTDWSAVLRPYGGFTPMTCARFAWAQPMTADRLVDAASSRSYILAMTPEARAPILAAVRALVAGWPEPFDLPHVTQVWTCRRLP
jgi:SAM-dependent methyltransferase